MIYSSCFNTMKTSQRGLITKKSLTLSFSTFYILPQAEDLGEKNQALNLLTLLDSFLMVIGNAPEHKSFITSPGTNKLKIYNSTLSEVILTSQGAVRQNALYDISTSDGCDNQKKIENMTICHVFSIWTILKSKSSRWQANWDGIFLAMFFLQRSESVLVVRFPFLSAAKKNKSPLANRHVFTG